MFSVGSYKTSGSKRCTVKVTNLLGDLFIVHRKKLVFECCGKCSNFEHSVIDRLNKQSSSNFSVNLCFKINVFAGLTPLMVIGNFFV